MGKTVFALVFWEKSLPGSVINQENKKVKTDVVCLREGGKLIVKSGE